MRPLNLQPPETAFPDVSCDSFNHITSIMVKFEPPLFVKPPDPKGDVIPFGKAPHLQLQDSANGVSRFGGAWRAPDYFFAYLESAAILVEQGAQNRTLDDIGLPAFYLQRHATELLIKRLLSWLYELAELRSELCPDWQGVPSSEQKKNFKRSHNLPQLFKDLCLVSKHFRFAEPPIELGELVHEIANFETSETWARYERSEAKGGAVIHHVQNEVIVALVDLQQRLELVAFKTSYQFTGEQTYEMELYEEWLNAARAAGRAG